jgi:hypothetical protein
MEDKYVCIKRGQWQSEKCKCNSKDPSYSEVVTVISLIKIDGLVGFVLKGYESCKCVSILSYNSAFFRPIDDVLSEISLEEVEEVLNTELVEV